MRYSNLAAIVVHARAYRETSAMVQFFTETEGRLVGVMRGARRGRNPVQIQPFRYGALSCVGREGLLTVTRFDLRGHYELAGDALSAGFYVLELIARTLAERQSEPLVFHATHAVLLALSEGEALAPALRAFEMTLLAELGYAPDYAHDASSGEPVEPHKLYRWEPDHGIVPADEVGERIPGAVLLAIAAGDYDEPRVLRTARQLNQQALAPLLGSKPLLSRAMFAARKPKA